MPDGEEMREEYEINKLNPRRNPYAQKMKQQITININSDTVEYFINMASETGVAYQVLINMYLDECVRNKKKLSFV